MRQPFTLGVHVPDYNCEPSAGFFFIIYKNMSVCVRIKIKKNILHLLAGYRCVHHKNIQYAC